MLQFGTDAADASVAAGGGRAAAVEYRHDVVAGDDCFVLDDGEVMRGEAGGEEALRCSICLDPLRDATLLRMPCARNHIFHKICLLAWLETKNSCPVCRHRLPTEADEAEEREEEAAERRAAAQQDRAAAAAAAAAGGGAAGGGRGGGDGNVEGGDALRNPNRAGRWARAYADTA